MDRVKKIEALQESEALTCKIMAFLLFFTVATKGMRKEYNRLVVLQVSICSIIHFGFVIV